MFPTSLLGSRAVAQFKNAIGRRKIRTTAAQLVMFSLKIRPHESYDAFFCLKPAAFGDLEQQELHVTNKEKPLL